MGLFSMFSRKKHRKTAPDQIGADQSSVFSRISNLLRANIHAALDEAEDPERMLDQFVRDFTANIKDAEEAVAETIGNLRLMERDRLEAAKEVETWQTRAIAASNRAEEQKAKGQSHQAEKSDRLATDAIMKFQSTKRRVSELDPQIENQNEMVEQLKYGLEGMKTRLSELKTKRSELLSRSHIAEAQERVVSAVGSLNTADPTSELSRFEEKVRKREALAQGRIEIAASSMDNQYAELEADTNHSDAQAALAALKRGDSSALLLESAEGSQKKGEEML